jgi:hypothetical protein
VALHSNYPECQYADPVGVIYATRVRRIFYTIRDRGIPREMSSPACPADLIEVTAKNGGLQLTTASVALHVRFL